MRWSGIDAIDSGVTPCMGVQIPQHGLGIHYLVLLGSPFIPHVDLDQYILDSGSTRSVHIQMVDAMYRESPSWVGARVARSRMRTTCLAAPLRQFISCIGFLANNNGPIPFAAQSGPHSPISGGG